MFDICLQMSDRSLPIIGYVATCLVKKPNSAIDQRHQLGYSNVWSLLSVSITTLDDAVPFFTAWRVFQSKLLT